MPLHKKHNNEQRIVLIAQSAKQVGRPIFLAVLIIVVSFLPVFLLTGQEGKLFHPLAWTKTLVMVCSMFLTVTLIPVLMVLLMRGKMRPEHHNPVSRFFENSYEPVLLWCFNWKRTILSINLLGLLAAGFLLTRMGREFMPPLDEGTLLFMPVALPDVSNAEIKRILRIQDKIIARMPEVQNVLGKAGRISSATDNAPINMIETIVMLKPRADWPAGITKEDIVNRLNRKLQIPGVTNGWTQPIINRINMLSTGIGTDVGIKIFGQDLDTLAQLSKRIAAALKGIPGVVDLYPEHISGGRFLNIKIRKEAIGRYGITTEDVETVIETALRGMDAGQLIQGRERYDINIRLAQDWRNSLEGIKRIPVQTRKGQIPLSVLTHISIQNGPSMINSENAMLRGVVQFNVRGRDLGQVINAARNRLDRSLILPKGYYLEWSGQWKNELHAARTLKIILPIVILLILLILYFTFQDFKDTLNTFLSVPFAFTGGVLLTYIWGEQLSIAVAVGFIALFGIATETGVVMMIYLEEAMQKMVRKEGAAVDLKTLRHYIVEGAVKRLRPKLMTVFVILLGLVPVLWSNGRGIELMRPIALPMIGGIATSAISILFVMPILFEGIKEWELRKYGAVRVRRQLQ